MRTIGAAVTIGTKRAFESAAQARGTTASRLNRSLIEAFLMQETGTASTLIERAAPDAYGNRHAKTPQVVVRLEPYYYAELERLAAEKLWFRGTYLANLFYAHADQRPVLCHTEINALRQLARQLASMSRSLHLAASHQRTAPGQAQVATLPDYNALEALVASEVNAVKSLIRANLRGWGVSDEAVRDP